MSSHAQKAHRHLRFGTCRNTQSSASGAVWVLWFQWAKLVPMVPLVPVRVPSGSSCFGARVEVPSSRSHAHALPPCLSPAAVRARSPKLRGQGATDTSH
uniref:Uncharacterized protein n=1 Tax=Knipowitschia caucasica TaxID=637954 RepID=A0AAV2K0A1_KNICA